MASTYSIGLNEQKMAEIIAAHNVNANIDTTDLLAGLNIRGYWNEDDINNLLNPNNNTPIDTDQSNVRIAQFDWNGEQFNFVVNARSKRFNTVSTIQSFTIDFSSKFAAMRQTSLILAIFLFLLGVGLVAAMISIYALRRNKIRRLMK